MVKDYEKQVKNTKEYLEELDSEFAKHKARIDAEIKAEQYKVDQEFRLDKKKRRMAWERNVFRRFFSWVWDGICSAGPVLAIIAFVAFVVGILIMEHFYRVSYPESSTIEIFYKDNRSAIEKDVESIERSRNDNDTYKVYYFHGGEREHHGVLKWKPIKEETDVKSRE